MATKTGITGNIHSAQHHDSAAKHVSGQAVYVDDINMPTNSLVVLIGQSPHAHASATLIRSVDFSHATTWSAQSGRAVAATMESVPIQ